ncbi:hypothetical protein GWI33_007784 [Rhynchophorus ferrugineus]|uniref:Uncharacterized protein n=1 Tax=Rhynchophorus ferrugineus TaxID=354439 RepID=A0A834IDX2_RHYFE|nr:hypothetical protein GWI33_007784 [Rhynchophorus ferrugineus]
MDRIEVEKYDPLCLANPAGNQLLFYHLTVMRKAGNRYNSVFNAKPSSVKFTHISGIEIEHNLVKSQFIGTSDDISKNICINHFLAIFLVAKDAKY